MLARQAVTPVVPAAATLREILAAAALEGAAAAAPASLASARAPEPASVLASPPEVSPPPSQEINSRLDAGCPPAVPLQSQTTFTQQSDQVTLGESAAPNTSVISSSDSNAVSACTAAISAEMQRLEQRLEEWLKQLESRLEGYIETWGSNVPKPSGEDPALQSSADLAADLVPFDDTLQPVQVEQPRQGQEYELYQQWQADPRPPPQPPPPEPQELQCELEALDTGPLKLLDKPLRERVLEEPKADEGREIGGDDCTATEEDVPGKGDRTDAVQRAKTRMHEARAQTYHELFHKHSSHVTIGHRHERLSAIVVHPFFDYLILVAVAVNSVLIGAQVQHNSVSEKPNQFLKNLEIACSIAFLLEWLLRVYALGWAALCRPAQRRWTIFDTFLVFMSVLDFVMSSFAATMGNMAFTKSMKIVKMAKVLRLLRIINFLGELRVMAMMIVNSLISLFWLLCLLIGILYTVAIILTQGSVEYLREEPWMEGRPPIFFDEVNKHYGSLFRTMYSLFKGMTGGISWGEIAELWLHVGWPYFAIFMMYIFFTLFSVLNIVTGVFVDSAIQASQRDRGVLMDKQRKAQEATTQHLLVLLEEIDKDHTGSITTEELALAMENQRVMTYFNALQIDIRDISQLMKLLDRDGDGEIDITEFVDGLLSLKGEAKSFDIHMLIMQNRQVLGMMVKYFAYKGWPMNGPGDRESLHGTMSNGGRESLSSGLS